MAIRDEILRFVFETKGQEGLDQLAAALAKAGAEGGESGAKLTALSEQLSALLAQAKQADALQLLQEKLAGVDEKLDTARARVAALNTEYGEIGPRTAEVTAQFAAAEKAVADLSAQQANLAVRASTTSAALSASGVDVTNLAAAQAELAAKAKQTASILAETAAEANRTGEGFTALKGEAASAAAGIERVAVASKEASESEKAEAISVSELGEKYRNLGQILETVKGLIVTLGALATFDKLKDSVEEVVATGDKMQKWQIQLTNLYGSVEQGHEAFEKLEEVAHNTPLTLSQVMESAITMKRQGLDPLNGTLETLIKANKAYGGSYDELSGVIESFAKESAKGELSSRLLMQMQLAGIPAVRLLGEAMGKTEDQIRAMATAGDLGADAIGLLLDQLKKVGDNPAATGMTTIQAQVNSVKKSWEEFLELIAKSGLYDYARQEITEVATALKTALADGEAKQKAQAISDAIVGIGKAAASVLGFLVDHAGAIKLVAEAYAGLKITTFAVDLAKMVVAWGPATAAAVANRIEVIANTLAQRELAASIAAAGVASGEEATKLAGLVLEMQAAAGGATLLTEQQIAVARSLQASAVAAKEETVALQENATAKLKAAVAEGEFIAATKAGTAARGEATVAVGSGIASLTKFSVVAGVTAAATYALTEAIVEGVPPIKNYLGGVDKLNQLEQERIETQKSLVDQAAKVATATKEAADVQIKSAQDITKMSNEEAEQYKETLQEAVKYYTAKRIAAREADDTDAVNEYTRILTALEKSFRDTQRSFEDFADESKNFSNLVSSDIAKLVDQIADFRAKGEAAPEAVGLALDKLDVNSKRGFADFIGVLKEAGENSNELKDAIGTQLLQALQKLDAQKLEAFRANVARAFVDGKINAEQLQAITQAIAQKDFLALGLSAQDAGQKITEAGAHIISEFTRIADNASLTGKQIHDSFSSALDQATTEAEVRALVKVLQDALDKGRISAAQFADGIAQANLKLGDLADELAKTNEKFSALGKAAADLGITLQTDLARAADKAKAAFDVIDQSSAQTAAGLADRRAAFLAYAKAALDASAQLDQGTKDSVQYQLESKAASLGVLDALKELEGQGKKTGDAIASGMDEAAQATREAEQQTQRYNDAMATLRDTTASLVDKQKALAAADENAADASQKAAAAAEGVESSMLAAMGAGQSLAQVTANSRAEFEGLSGALAEFDQGAQQAAQSSLSLSDYFAGLQSVYDAVKQRVDGVSASLQNQASILDTVGTDQDKFFNGTIAGADDAIAKLAYLKNSLRSVDDGFAKPEDIARYNQALDGAIQRMQALADAELAAKDAFKSLSDQLQDQADQNAGNQTAIENRRFQKQLDDLKAAAAKANELSSAQYQRDLANAEAIHAKNMADIAAEAAAKKTSASTSSSASSSPTSSSGASTSTGYSGSPAVSSSSGGSAGVLTHRLEVTINGNGVGYLDPDDPKAKAAFSQMLTNVLAAARRSAGGH